MYRRTKRKNRQGVLRSRQNQEIYERWIKGIRKNAEKEEWRKKISVSVKKRWGKP